MASETFPEIPKDITAFFTVPKMFGAFSQDISDLRRAYQEFYDDPVRQTYFEGHTRKEVENTSREENLKVLQFLDIQGIEEAKLIQEDLFTRDYETATDEYVFRDAWSLAIAYRSKQRDLDPDESKERAEVLELDRRTSLLMAVNAVAFAQIFCEETGYRALGSIQMIEKAKDSIANTAQYLPQAAARLDVLVGDLSTAS